MAIVGHEITGMWLDEAQDIISMFNNDFTEKEVRRVIVLKDLIKDKVKEKLKVLPDEISDALRTHCYLSGGVTASIAHWEEPNDLDFYCVKKVMTLKFEGLIKKHFLDLVVDVDEKYIDKYVDGKCITGNAITLNNGVQIITRGAFEEMHNVFDFIHCKPYYDLLNDKFYISRKQFHAIMQKKLIAIPNGVSEADRTQKFKDRGWTL